MEDTKTISVVIAHAAHRPERVETLCRLMKSLWSDGHNDNVIHIDQTRGAPHEWSHAQWTRGATANRDYCVFLNDDMVACDNFWPTLKNVLRARPSHIINLYCGHHGGLVAYNKGLKWVTTVDGLIGNAYVMPTEIVKDFLAWRLDAVVPTSVELLSEDQLINLYAMWSGALIWHTVPSLFDHDTSVPSLYGNTQLRKPSVGPKPDMHLIDWNTDAVHVGRQFRGNHWGLIQHMKKDWRRVERAYQLEREHAAA